MTPNEDITDTLLKLAGYAVDNWPGLDITDTPEWRAIEEIERLRAASTEYPRRVIPGDPCAVWFDRAKEAEAEVERLRAELAKCREDAERYRWLMDASGLSYAELANAQLIGRLSEAIDAARTKPAEGK